MDYNDFIAEIRKGVQNRMGGTYDIDIHKVTKNNGHVLDGLTITRKEDNLSPTILLNSYFQQYEDGMMMKEIVTEICASYYINFKNISEEITIDLRDLNAVKDIIACNLISRHGNELLLSDIPSTSYLDLEIVYYLIISKEKDSQITALIHNEHMKIWNVTTKEIHELAKTNTEKLLPAIIVPIEEVLCDLFRQCVKEGNDLCDLYFRIDQRDRLEKPLFVSKNSTGQNGAVTILYEGVLEKFSKEMEADIIIIPSSIHEMLLLPLMDELDLNELREVVSTINSTVEAEDVLSDNIYVYYRECNEIQIIQ